MCWSFGPDTKMYGCTSRKCLSYVLTTHTFRNVLIDGIKQLTILGETGAASRDAIRFCGSRWRRAGRRVFIVMPSVGSDLNDELKESV